MDPEEQDPEEKALKAPQVGSITGTDNDLRRLFTVEMKSILLAWGVEPSAIPTNRWRLVDLIRQVGTALAKDHVDSESLSSRLGVFVS